MDKDEIRSNYLIQWRQGLWAQIRQKEDAIWRFISFYSAAIIFVAGFVQSKDSSGGPAITLLGALLIILVFLIVTFWGLLIVLDANYWMARNLLFVGNIERELLYPTDLGVLLPSSYAKPARFSYSRSYKIHTHIYFFTILLTLLGFTIMTFANGGKSGTFEVMLAGLISITFCMGFLYLFEKDQEWIRDYNTVRINAPGKDATPPKLPMIFDQSIIYWSSFVNQWGWLLSLLGCGIFLFLAIYEQKFINFLPWFKLVVLSIFWIIGISGLFVRYIISKFQIKRCEKIISSLSDIQQMENSKCVKNLQKIQNVLSTIQRVSLITTALIWLVFILYQGILLLISM